MLSMKFPPPLVSNEFFSPMTNLRLWFVNIYFIHQNPEFQSKQQQNENWDHFRSKKKIQCYSNISMHEIDLFQIPAEKKCSFDLWIDSSSWTISIFHFARFRSVYLHIMCVGTYCFWYIVLGSYHHNNNNSLHDCVLNVIHFSMCFLVHFLRFNNEPPMTVRNYGNIFEWMILVYTLRRKNNLIREVKPKAIYLVP